MSLNVLSLNKRLDYHYQSNVFRTSMLDRNVNSHLIEAVLFAFVFTFTLWQPLLPQLIYSNILNKTEVVCGGYYNQSYCTYCIQCEAVCYELLKANEDAQKQTSQLMLSVFILNEIIGVISSFIWGEFSDRKSRKIPMVASCAAHTIFVVVLILFSMKWTFFESYLILFYMLISATGGNLTTMYVGAVSLIADITTADARIRTKRLAINEGFFVFAQFLGYSTGGVAVKHAGPLPVCCFCVLSYSLLLIYCLLLPDPEQRQPIYIITKQRRIARTESQEQRCRFTTETKLLLFFNISARIAFSSPKLIFVMFLLPTPFLFNAELIGVFLGYKLLSQSFVCFSFALLPRISMQDINLATTGLALLAVSYLIFIVATSIPLLFIGATFYGMYGLASIALKSLLSQSVKENKYAQPFAIITGVESLTCCLMTPLISMVYQYTRSWVHGFCFLIPLAITLVNLVLFLSYDCWQKSKGGTAEEILPLLRRRREKHHKYPL